MFSGDVLIPRLKELYRDIDASYLAAASPGGYPCAQCDGMKCCTVDVTLLTFMEMLYLRRGFDTMDISEPAPVETDVSFRLCSLMISLVEQEKLRPSW